MPYRSWSCIEEKLSFHLYTHMLHARWVKNLISKFSSQKFRNPYHFFSCGLSCRNYIFVVYNAQVQVILCHNWRQRPATRRWRKKQWPLRQSLVCSFSGKNRSGGHCFAPWTPTRSCFGSLGSLVWTGLFYLLHLTLLKFNISAQLIKSFPAAYGLCSTAAEKLSVLLQVDDFRSSSENFKFFVTNFSKDVICLSYSLPH